MRLKKISFHKLASIALWRDKSFSDVLQFVNRKDKCQFCVELENYTLIHSGITISRCITRQGEVFWIMTNYLKNVDE